jgi:antitoxin component of MazEF toxin-antitoxin module
MVGVSSRCRIIVRVEKRGKDLAVPIPQAVAKQARIREGTEVEVLFDKGRLVISPAKVASLRELLARIEPGDRPALVDWGKPIGKEIDC